MEKIMPYYYVVTLWVIRVILMLHLTVQEVSLNGEVFESRQAEDVVGVIKPHRVQTWRKYYHPV